MSRASGRPITMRLSQRAPSSSFFNLVNDVPALASLNKALEDPGTNIKARQSTQVGHGEPPSCCVAFSKPLCLRKWEEHLQRNESDMGNVDSRAERQRDFSDTIPQSANVCNPQNTTPHWTIKIIERNGFPKEAKTPVAMR